MQAKHWIAIIALASLTACSSIPPVAQDAAGTLAHKPDVAADYFMDVCQRTRAEQVDIMKEFNAAIYPHAVQLACGPENAPAAP